MTIWSIQKNFHGNQKLSLVQIKPSELSGNSKDSLIYEKMNYIQL